MILEICFIIDPIFQMERDWGTGILTNLPKFIQQQYKIRMFCSFHEQNDESHLGNQ